jgi:hypothetical protein
MRFAGEAAGKAAGNPFTRRAGEAAQRASALGGRMGPAFGAARDRMAPRIEAARGSLGPRAQTAFVSARDRMRDDVIPLVAQTVTEEVVPRVSQAWTASEPARDEAKARGALALAALRGELSTPEIPTGRRRGRVVAVLAVLAAIGGCLFWRSQNRREAWLLAEVEDEQTTDSGATVGDGSSGRVRWNAVRHRHEGGGDGVSST